MSKCHNCKALITVEEATECKHCSKPLHKDCAIKTKSGDYCDLCYEIKGELKPTFELPESIRRSYIDEYRDCPYSAYLDIVKEVNLPSGSFAEVGIKLHEVFEEYNNEKKPQHEMNKIMIEKFNSIPNESFESSLNLFKDKTLEEHKEDMLVLSMKSMQTFYELEFAFERDERRKLIDAEKTVYIDLGSEYPKLEMTFDRLDEVDGELELIDYKTGHVLVGKKLESNIQVPIYIIGVKQNYGRLPKRFVLHYLSENKTRIYEKVDDNTYQVIVGNKTYTIKLDAVIEQVKTILSDMKKGKWDVPTDFKNMYFKCKTCNKKKYGLCEGAEQQAWTTKAEFKWD